MPAEDKLAAPEPRSTIDIDVVAAFNESHIGPLIEAWSGEFYLDETALTPPSPLFGRSSLYSRRQVSMTTCAFDTRSRPSSTSIISGPILEFTDMLGAGVHADTYFAAKAAGPAGPHAEVRHAC